MGEHTYLHTVEEDEAELERLRGQTDIYDPVSIRHLEWIGVAEGWKCLEVGAGAGSIALWLSNRVGLSGRVIATDIDLRFLKRINVPNIETRKHDILKDELEKRTYDLVHCRQVLMHLSNPEKGLRQMGDAVRPGGWLLVEDVDAGSLLSADVTDSSAVSYVATLRAELEYYRKRSIADCYYGRRLRNLVEQLGFLDVGQEGWTHMVHGGDPQARSDARNYLFLAKPMIAEGLLTEGQVESVLRLYQDPTFNFPGLTLFSTWGRKPVQDTLDSSRGKDGGDD